MRLVLLLASGVVIFGALTLGPTRESAAAPDPAELFDQFATALSSGDVTGALALFSSDAVMELTAASGPGPGPGSGSGSGPGPGGPVDGPCPQGLCVGPEAIGTQLELQVKEGHELTLISAAGSVNRLFGSYELRSIATKQLGVERIIINFVLEETGGEISRFSFGPDMNDAETVSFLMQQTSIIQPPSTGDGGLASSQEEAPIPAFGGSQTGVVVEEWTFAMADFLTGIGASDIAPAQMKAIEIGGAQICLVNLAGTLFAVDNLCPHADGPLSEGNLDGEVVECPWHGSKFNVRTGAIEAPPASEAIGAYKVRVEDEYLLVELP